MDDATREQKIQDAARRMASAETEERKRWYWHEMKTLIEGRSAAMVERLEKAKGLHRSQQP